MPFHEDPPSFCVPAARCVGHPFWPSTLSCMIPTSRFPSSAIDPYDGSTGKTDSQQPASRTRSGSGFVSRCLYQRPVCLLRLRQPCVCSPAEPVINLSCAVLLVAITQIAGGSREVWGQPLIPPRCWCRRIGVNVGGDGGGGGC